MGFFDLFKSKPKTALQAEPFNKQELLQPTEVVPGISLPKALAQHWDEIVKCKLDFISIKATPAQQQSFQESGFGFLPRLPKGFAYPKDAEGNYMYPLAQINCSEIPVLTGFPNFGFLQFYISTNDTFGLDFDNQQTQDNWKVLYFTDDEVTDFETNFGFLDATISNENVPIFEPHRLSFSLSEEYAGCGDVRCQSGGANDMSKIIDRHPQVADELQDALCDTFEANGHKMGGYAFFTQSDPREGDEVLDKYILLLQIDTDDHIMWGDSGVGNFFIHPDDLAKKDFSKVLYNWDCC